MYFQGYHFLCHLYGKYYQHRWLVQRHLQDVHTGIQLKCHNCGELYARRTISQKCGSRPDEFCPIHTETGRRGEDARQYTEQFIRDRRDTHWSYVPKPDGDGVNSIEIGEKLKLKSIVTKVEKVKMPPINKRIHASKKRTLPKQATVTRPP